MKLDMSLAWNDAVALLKANRELMLVTAGVFFFLPALASVFLIPELNMAGQVEDPELVLDYVMEIYAQYGWLFVLGGLIQVVGLLALLALLSDVSKPTLGDALKAGLFGLLPYIGVQLLLVLGLMLVGGVLVGAPAAAGLDALAAVLVIALLVAALYVGVKMSMTTPVIAIEKIYNPVQVIRRSWQLTRGNSLRLLGFFALLVLVYLVISMILGAVFGLIGAIAGGMVVTGILTSLLGAVATMIGVAVLAAVHRQLAGPSAASVSETFE